MVGVPGRSKGCKTCRARKKRCDQQRPVCGQCIKGNYECGGYHRELIIVQHEPGPRVVLENAANPRTTSADFVSETIPGQPITSVSSESLNRTALEVKCFDAFWNMYLPKSQYQHSDIRSISIANWARAIQDLSPRDDTLRCALLAVSVSKVGQQQRNPAIIEHGIQLYGELLARMNNSLKDPSQYQRIEVLATCRLLAMYEQFFNFSRSNSAPGRNWQRHTEGIQRLVQMQGPAEYRDDRSHIIFQDVRLTGGIAALIRRKATFLGTPEWNTIPFSRGKTLRDELIDPLVALPSLCEDFDKLRLMDSNPAVEECGRDLLGRCWYLDGQLQSWYRKFTYQLTGFITADEARTMIDAFSTSSARVPPEVYWRQGHEILYKAVLHWTLCLITYSLMRVISKRFPESQSPQVFPVRTEPYPYALNIVRSVKYFFGSEAGLIGSLCVSFPIGTALNYLSMSDKTSKDFKELSKALHEAKEQPGSDWLARFLIDLQKSSVQQTHGRSPAIDADGFAGLRARAQAWYGTTQSGGI